ncbi:MAG: superoxide dismutase, Ni [Phycisphaerae bacterium]|nr:superoxide dismutase, Ni [Phycisphaerae bacterium]
MKNTIGKKFVMLAVLACLVILTSMVYSHCQIPCGIYDDPQRFDMMAENITTIEKSMNQITDLSKESKPNMNQIVRWVQNKEEHADEICHIVTFYFMSQRIKPVDRSDGKAYAEYVQKLTLLHEMLVYSMKAKQTTDLSNVEKLKALLKEFETAYFGEAGHKH